MTDNNANQIPVPLRREVGRRRIPGTHKVEIVYAVRDPQDPTIETFVREITFEKGQSKSS